VKTVLVVGEALVDVVTRPDGSVQERPGGSPANVAVALARLGRATILATSLGQDAFGTLVADHLVASGVELADGSVGERPTSSAVATIQPAGHATYDFDVAWDPTLPADPGKPVVVHSGSIAATLSPGAAAVQALLRDLRASATVSYDINARPALMQDPGSRDRVRELVALSDVVKASDEDLVWLQEAEDWRATARDLLATGPAAVVVTRGGDGATVVTGGGEIDVAPVPVVVADTIGAGDTFSAGLVDALWSRGLLGAAARADLRSLSLDAWRDVAAYAARLAAVTVSRPGADPPWHHEL